MIQFRFKNQSAKISSCPTPAGVHAKRLVGALSVLKSTLTLIQEEASALAQQGLVSEQEKEQFNRLALEVSGMTAKFNQGEFLSDLGPIVRGLRGSKRGV